MKTKTILDEIRRKKSYLNPALRRIAEFVIEHPDLCKTMTISQLAIACSVSESTVTRFVRELDLRSYHELKIAMAEALYAIAGLSEEEKDRKFFFEGVTREDSAHTIIEKVVQRNIETLHETGGKVHEREIERAAQAVERADTIVFCGMGSSAVSAEEGVMRFIRAGKKCLLYRDESLQRMSSAIVKPEDLVIGISNSGRSGSVVAAIRMAHSRGIPTLAITSFEDSPLAHAAGISLFTPTKSPPPGLDLYGEATTSITAQLLILDIIYTIFAASHFDETLRNLEITYAIGIKDSRMPE